MSEPTTPPAAAAIAVMPSATDGAQLAEMERRLEVWDARRSLVLKVLNSTDVVRMGSRLAKNRYASEKLLSIFGGRLELLKDADGRPIIERTMIDDDPDMGRVIVFTTFSRYTRADGVVFEAAGSFSSKDDFFALDHGEYRRFSDIDLANVMSAAFTESQKKAIFRGCGLGDFDDGEQTTVLMDTARGHDFAGSAPKKGGADPVVAFGSQKGKRVSELEPKDLAWYAKVYTENVADPAKARYVKDNRAVLDAITARMKPTAPPAGATGDKVAVADPAATTEGAAEPPAEETTPTTRGGLIGAAFRIVEQHAGKSGKAQSAFLRAVSQAALGCEEPAAALTALTDDQLRTFLALTEVQLETIKANG